MLIQSNWEKRQNGLRVVTGPDGKQAMFSYDAIDKSITIYRRDGARLPGIV
jgi:hypothetical protein